MLPVLRTDVIAYVHLSGGFVFAMTYELDFHAHLVQQVLEEVLCAAEPSKGAVRLGMEEQSVGRGTQVERGVVE